MIGKSYTGDFRAAVVRSGVATADYLTHQLRIDAANHGWDIPSEAMHVRYDGAKFNVHVHEDHADAAHVLEYGNERQRPTAVIRKLNNNTGPAKEFFVKHLGQGLRGKI